MSRFRSIRALVFTVAVAMFPLAAVAVTAPPGNYCQSRAQIVTLVSGGLLTWKTSQPAGWSTDNTEVTQADFIANIANGGSCNAGGASYLINWSQMIATGCATNHTVSQQSLSAAGSYQGTYYTYSTATKTCALHNAVPFTVTLPAGTVAPTSSSVQLTLALSGISYTYNSGSSTTLSAQLYNPSGTAVGTPFQTSSANPPAWTYYASGAPAGAWYWQITSSGAAGESCTSVDGVSGSADAASWSGTAYYYQ